MSTLRTLLGLRNNRLLWTGQVVSNFGDALTNLALLILTLRLTDSTAAVAGTAIAIALPQLLFGMVAGAYVDRWDRKRVMIVSDVVRGAMVLGFLLVGSADQMWLLYTIAFAQATVGTFFLPAKSALLPAIVDRDDLLSANSVSESSRVIFMLLGTAAAGVLAGTAESIRVVFWIDAATFLVSALLLTGIRAATAPERTATAQSVWASVWSGIAVVGRSRVLVGVVIGGAVIMLVSVPSTSCSCRSSSTCSRSTRHGSARSKGRRWRRWCSPVRSSPCSPNGSNPRRSSACRWRRWVSASWRCPSPAARGT